MNTSQIKPVTMGVDFGGGAIKLYGPGGGIELAAHVAAGHRQQGARAAGLKTLTPPMHITMSGNGFYVGLGAHDWGRPVENLGDERFAGSPEVQAIFYGSLALYEQEHGPLDHLEIIAGLTQSAFSEDFSDTMVSNVRSWVIGHHEWNVDDPANKLDDAFFSIEVDKINVTSQAAGALFDYFLDCDGAFIPARKPQFNEEVGIVSVGMNTLELLVIRKGAPIARFLSSETAGVRRLLEIVDPRGHYSRGELDTLLRSGKLDYKDALPVWAAEINGHIERAWGAAFRRFSAIILVGGGAILLQDEIRHRLNGRAYVPNEPILSVARGLFKMGKMWGKRRR